MLRKINKYSHGFVFIPVGVSLKQIGFFDYLSNNGPQGFSEIVNHFKANSGYLKACLDMLHVMDWLDYVDGKYFLTGKSEENEYLPLDLLELYEFSPEELVSSREPSSVLKRWLGPLINGWGCEEPLSDMLDGVILIPLLLGFARNDLVGAINNFDIDRLPFVAELRDVFISKKWANNKDGSFVINGTGKFMLGRCHVAGVTVSYRPMLASLPKLLCGDADSVMRSEGGDERHIDRTLNVQSSSFQHEKYFKDMEQAVVSIFSGVPLDKQPDYVADMGCGDGTLLKRIHNVVLEKTERGKTLNTRPVVMVGLDYNIKSLTEAAKTLADVPNKLMFGDISDPSRVEADFAGEGVDDPGKVMHVRSFLDHNRSYVVPVDASGVEKWGRLPFESSGIGDGGVYIPPSEMMQSLSEHLGRWREILGEYGLLCLEVHAQTGWAKKHFFDVAEGFHFDTLHAFSRQYLCEPEYFMAAMAENGLFADVFFQSYPRGFPYTRITLGYYKKRPYTINFAHSIDIKELFFLSAENGYDHQRIESLLDEVPELSFALVEEGGLPRAVLFCSYTDNLKDGRKVVKLETVLRRTKEDDEGMQILLSYAVKYLTLKDLTIRLKGTVMPNLLNKLDRFGALPADGERLFVGEEFIIDTEN